jgi:hypothetical protein
MSAAVPAHGDSSMAGRPHQSLFGAVNDRNIETIHTLILSPGARWGIGHQEERPLGPET